ncbi:MAG: inositol monophosphatase family protein [Desulfobulbales bacterium]|nr:inositol monophosphatase family protein [Desulfobulbales bacterium]
MPGRKSDTRPTTVAIKQCLEHCRSPEIFDVLQVAATAALKAGAILQERYARPHQILHKGAIDLVTEADLAAEELILGVLHQNMPGVEIVSEESFSSYDNITEKPLWIIDPLDGTTNFAHNFPWFAVSIAFYAEGKTQAGVIYNPIQKELFCGTLAGGAWLNDQPIKVSKVSSLKNALVATGFPYDVRDRADSILAMLKAVLTHTQGVRRPGAAALDLAYIACGRLDAFWEVGLKPWDAAAGHLLVEEAGGTLSDFAGASFSPFIPELLASNTYLHGNLVALLHEFSTMAP